MSNLSKIRRDKMIEFLETLKEQHSDDESLIAINQIEKELVSKRYGLVWEEHEEAVDVMMRENVPVFTEVKEREISMAEGEGYNFLLEGDNLHSLHLLEKTHRGKVDVIYIDPPYNTMNEDFMYNDSYVDQNDGYGHSKWISFMEARLKVAKNLLSNDGYICISIDDRELYNLKLLCDSIFGEENFVNNIVVKSSEASGLKMSHTEKRIPKIKEYVLLYKKNNICLNPISIPKENWDDEYKSILTNITDDELKYINSVISKNDRTENEIDRCNELLYKANYEFLTETYRRLDLKTKAERQKFNYENSHRIFQTCSMGSGATQFINEKRSELCKNIFFCYESAQKKLYIIKGDYDLQKKKPRMQVLFAKDYLSYNPCDLWSDIKTTGMDAEGGVSFKNGKKPIKLLKRLLTLSAKQPTVILDFFAGSGSTAQAVLELNNEDNGNRKFILCTNNENDICSEITYPRVKTVIDGVKMDGTKYSEGISANLKYYRTDFVAKDNEYLVDSLLEHVAEMIQLEHGIKLDNKSHIMIMNDEEADELEQNWSQYIDVKAIYVAQDVLLTASQEALFGTVDVYVIPDYYFNFELREAGELW